jgi:lysophospholipase L1-like esterase
MRKNCFRLLLLVVLGTLWSNQIYARAAMKFYPADHSFIQYMGRIDFSNPKLPRFWQPGVTVSFRFKGTDAVILLNDEQLWGSNQNYVELVVDGHAVRLQTKGKTDTLSLKAYLGAGEIHEVVLCKNTEANIGYMELAGIRCDQLVKPAKQSKRKIECIGNSITCGASSDLSGIPCGKGKWQDQHNAWLSYGAVTARTLKAQVHLSSVSGIGLMRSCCNLDIIMPRVYDKISMRNDSIPWNFSNYQPDFVTVCLGQNDGVQDSTLFCNNYISFLKTLRGYYPKAKILLLSSPMADIRLREFLRSSLKSVLHTMQDFGDKRIRMHVFEQSYTGGCDYHPSTAEHALIAAELTRVVRQWMKW